MSKQVRRDGAERSRREKLRKLGTNYGTALKEIDRLNGLLKSYQRVEGTVKVHQIPASPPSSENNDAVCVWLASDWHVEERVDPRTINGLNRYSMAIAKQRSETFFRSGLRITQMLSRDIDIKTVVLSLLGDFITNDIHEELVELNQTQPIHAILYAQELIASGIQYVLDNSEFNLVIPCVSGNHGRTTRTTHSATENGHSLEFLMYRNLAAHFAGNQRVKFVIAEGSQVYLKLLGYTVRFIHGHQVRYQGGVGGLTIPMNKAVAQWDKAIRADLTCAGHFHQFFDGGNFVVNGSMIGYNAYALSIKAAFEKPKQMLFLIDRKRGKTVTAPICFD